MWVLIAIAVFPVAIAITFFVLARLNIKNPLYSGIDVEPDTRRCPYCHKTQDPIAPGVYTCPQCKADLIIKDGLVVRFSPKENQKVDLSFLPLPQNLWRFGVSRRLSAVHRGVRFAGVSGFPKRASEPRQPLCGQAGKHSAL